MVTTTPIPTATVANPAPSPASAILAALGTGSGIDTVTLATNLTAADRAPKDAALKTKTAANTAQISALAQVQSGLASFTSAIDNLATSGDLGLQPSSTDPSTVSIARDPSVAGAQPLATSMQVQAIAGAQTLVSGAYASANAAVGRGTLTLDFGTLTTNAGGAPTSLAANPALHSAMITIGSGNDTLSGLASAINAANTGVNASVLNDGTGYRLVLRGATGAAEGFTLTAATAPGSPAGDTALASLAFAPGANGLTLNAAAADAKFTVDGIAVTRPTNSVSDALPGYTLTLNRAAPGANVTLTASRDNVLLADAVNTFVAAYNQFNTVLGSDIAAGNGSVSAGALYGEGSVRSVQSRLTALTTTPFTNGAGTVTLADLGVATAQDGSLSVDATKLHAAIAADPGSVQALLSPPQATSPGFTPPAKGLQGALDTLQTSLSASNGGFSTLSSRLTQQKSALATEAAAIDTAETAYSATLTAQFTAMNAAVSAYKSIGSFLTQQIALWTNTNNTTGQSNTNAF